MHKKLATGLAALTLSVATAQPASAAVALAGGSQISITGLAKLIGPAGSTANLATSIDFLTIFGKTGNADGNISAYDGTGSFIDEVCGGACGAIKDITNLVPGPLTEVFHLTDGVIFTLSNITSINRSVFKQLSFTGTGTFSGFLNGNAISATPGNFEFSAQGTGRTTFSASAVTPVPEPATWLLMLLGFGGVGYGMRRRSKSLVARVA